jgi:phosphate uptake regulator
MEKIKKYILEQEGYLKQENDNDIQFIKNIGGDLYTIIFYKHIRMFEAFVSYGELSYSTLLDSKELSGINEIVKELEWIDDEVLNTVEHDEEITSPELQAIGEALKNFTGKIRF